MKLLFIVAALLVTVATGCGPSLSRSPEQTSANPLTNEEKAALATLEEAENPQELERAYTTLAKSRNKVVWQKLGASLQDPAMWTRLTPKKGGDKENYPSFYFAQILGSVAQGPRDEANQLFVQLGRNRKFRQSERAYAFIVAAQRIRQPSPQFLEFLVEYYGDDDWGLMSMLAELRSVDAYKLIEKHVLRQPQKMKHAFCQRFYRYRNEEAMAALYLRLMANDYGEPNLTREIQEKMLLSMFNWQRSWFDSAAPPEFYPPPPTRREAGTKALEQVLELAKIGLTLEIPEETKKAIRKGRAEVEEILDFRKKGGPERIAKCIAELDSEDYAVRFKATQQLQKEGDWAEPALKEALNRDVSQETRRRIELILGKIQKKKA